MPSDEVRSTCNDEDNDDEDEAAGSRGNRQGAAPKRRRKKNPSVLDEETESMLGEWLEEEAEFIYNKGTTEYKDKAKADIPKLELLGGMP